MNPNSNLPAITIALSLFLLSGCATTDTTGANKEQTVASDNYHAQMQHLDQGLLYANQNDMGNAIKEFKHSIAILPSVDAYSNLGAAYMKQGKLNLAKDALDKGEGLDKQNGLVESSTLLYNLTALYALNDQTDRALVYLDKTLAQGFSNFDAIRFDPDLANLRAEPEFRTTLEKHGVFIQ